MMNFLMVVLAIIVANVVMFGVGLLLMQSEKVVHFINKLGNKWAMVYLEKTAKEIEDNWDEYEKLI